MWRKSAEILLLAVVPLQAASPTLDTLRGGRSPAAPAPPPPASTTAGRSDQPRKIASFTLEELERAREATWLDGQVGEGRLAFNLGFDMDKGVWFLAREGEAAAAFLLDELDAGQVRDLPSGPVELIRVQSGLVLVRPADRQTGPVANVSVPQLIQSAYAASPQLDLTAVRYSIVRDRGEGGRSPSITLLRRDGGGRLYFAHHSDAELAKIVWFVAIDGRLYGMKLDGPALSIYSKPVPPS